MNIAEVFFYIVSPFMVILYIFTGIVLLLGRKKSKKGKDNVKEGQVPKDEVK